MKIYNYIVLVFLSLGLVTNAQLPSHLESNVLDGVYVQEHVPTKRVVQYTYLREADVMWSKRIWRIIDLREKQNHQLYYPLDPISDRMALWDVIRQGVLNEGSITCYELGTDFDDQFRYPIKPVNGNINDPDYKLKLLSKFGKKQTFNKTDDEGIEILDANDNPIVVDTIVPYFARDIIRYELKEDWFFDKQRSVMDVRIIGLSPVVYFENPETNEIEGTENLFWLYFPECRYMFQNYFVYNPNNDAQRMSFDDLFWKREFSSYIKKESNVYNRGIYPNEKGIDALLESEKIKEKMFDIEHDVWHF